MTDVSVLHFVILALGSEPSVLLGSGKLSSCLHKLIVGNGFGANEALFEIRMNLAGSLWSLGSFLDRPCAALILTGCQETDKTK